MNVIVSGSSGLIGTALVRSLDGHGHQVTPLVRGDEHEGIRWDPEAGSIDVDPLEGVDAVVHLAGLSIGARRWNQRHKERVLQSRERGTVTLSAALAALADPPDVLVSASAIGFYGDRGDEELTEDSGPGDGFVAEVCRRWEGATRPAQEAGIRVVHLRTGLVLGEGAELLKRMSLPFKLGLGGPLGSGRQWMSWVALADAVAAIQHLIETSGLTGPFNITAPHPVTNREFAQAMGRVLRRPAVIPVPAFVLKLVLGPEMARETALISQKVSSERLQESGFSFRYQEVEPALRAALDR